ncbi:unnamed protein product [Moneuplotes crassus]|uniref:UDENN domain-containing protein n=1 Tax=Euplotes crassus TaxID=5936 RepID=A0AAD2D414_EUPCR|nr:unnamed protein product [Moneuplotes crassus]
MDPRGEKPHRMQSVKVRQQTSPGSNVWPPAQKECQRCDYLLEELNVLKKQYENMVMRNVGLEREYQNERYEKEELSRLITKAGWSKGKLQKFLKNRDVIKTYDPEHNPKLEIERSFEEEEIPDESPFGICEKRNGAMPDGSKQQKRNHKWSKGKSVEGLQTPKIHNIPRQFTNQSKRTFKEESDDPSAKLDEEIVLDDDYIEVDDGPARPTPNQQHYVASPWKIQQNQETKEESNSESESESSTSSKDEETDSEYSDSSFEREEAIDKTVKTKEMFEDFKGYLDEDSILDSRPIYDPVPPRKSMRKSSITKQKEETKNFDEMPEKLRKPEKEIRLPSLTKKRSATVKNPYNPTENKEYMEDIFKSINNKNHLFLNPQFGSVFLGESAKLGRSIYSPGKKSILPLSATLPVHLREEGEPFGEEPHKNKQEVTPFQDKTDEFRIKRADSKGPFTSTGLDEYMDIQPSYFCTEDISEHCGEVKQLPLAPEFKHLKNPKFMAEFYIVGVDEMTLMSLNSRYEIVRPCLLYNYPNSEEHSERHKIIKDFCFPVGIEVERVDLSIPDLEVKISDVLYNRKIYLYDTFIFTLNGNDYNKGIIYEDEYLYCLTIVVKELRSTNVKQNDLTGQVMEQLFITKKAYCTMIRNTHFELHYKFLSALLKIQKHEQASMKVPISKQRLLNLHILPEYKDLVCDIEAMICMPNISDVCKETLREFYQLDPKDFKLDVPLTLEIPYKVCQFDYHIPESTEYTDIHWYGPFFLSWIEFKDFYNLFKAILLERSVIFISENHGLVTSMVNAFRILLKPFKWCHLFISLLPKLLTDYLWAPQPILLALSDKEEFFEFIDAEALEDKIIVECQENSIRIQGISEIPEFLCRGLKKNLRKMFKEFRKQTKDLIRGSIYDTSSREKGFSENIAKTIKESLEDIIIGAFRKYKERQRMNHLQFDFNDCKSYLVKNSKDRPFMKQFVDTQMFAFYYDTTVNK